MRTAVETVLASLEGAAHGFSFASGLAAEDVLLRALLRPGDGVVLGNDAYGGTYRLIDKVFRPAGHPWWAMDLTDPARLAAELPDGATVVWLETPTNPLLTCIDIEAIAEAAHARGATVVVDNTFATPYLQTPLALGADVVVHSATKYLGGHSDVVGGFVATSDDELATRLRFLQNATGAVPSPFDLYLLLRGVKTLGVRMDRHCANARAVVDLLVGHPLVERVLYPQLPDHPGHAAAARQMRDFGGMVSFVMRSEADALRVVERTRLFHAGRVARCRGVPDRAPGPDDPCQRRRLGPRGARRAGAPVGRHRVLRRPRRGPPRGPELGGCSPLTTRERPPGAASRR